MNKILSYTSWSIVRALHRVFESIDLKLNSIKSHKIWKWLGDMEGGWSPASPPSCTSEFLLSSRITELDKLTIFNNAISSKKLQDITTRSTKKGYKQYICLKSGTEYLFNGSVIMELS